MLNRNPEDEAMAEDLIDSIDKALNELSKREAFVVREVMNYDKQDYLAHLSDILNLTKERCHQIHAKAMRKLRHPVRCKDLREYLDWLNEN